MFQMEPRKDLIRFEHNGMEYAMTREEIDAAYDFVRREFLEEDALRQLNYLVFGYDGPDFGDDPEDAGPGEAEDLADFEEKYGITYMEAREHTAAFVTKFCCTTDCNAPENDLWRNAITSVLSELKEKKSMQE